MSDLEPVKVLAYACPHKCGSNVQTKVARARAHARVCFYNPATRSCATCVHFTKDDESTFCAVGAKDFTEHLWTRCAAWNPKP